MLTRRLTCNNGEFIKLVIISFLLVTSMAILWREIRHQSLSGIHGLSEVHLLRWSFRSFHIPFPGNPPGIWTFARENELPVFAVKHLHHISRNDTCVLERLDFPIQIPQLSQASFKFVTPLTTDYGQMLRCCSIPAIFCCCCCHWLSFFSFFIWSFWLLLFGQVNK